MAITPKPSVDYTIIVIMSCENNLMMESISAFNELAKVGTPPNINVLILMDRLQCFSDYYLGEYDYLTKASFAVPCVYELQKNNVKPKKLYKYLHSVNDLRFYKGENLNNIDNLATILSNIKTEYPAKQYGVVYKGHGGQTTDIYAYRVRGLVLPAQGDWYKKYNGKEGKEAGKKSGRPVEKKSAAQGGDDSGGKKSAAQGGDDSGGKKSAEQLQEDKVNEMIIEELKQRYTGKLENWDWNDWDIETESMDLLKYKIDDKEHKSVIVIAREKNNKKKSSGFLGYDDFNTALAKVFTKDKNNEHELRFLLLDCCWAMNMGNIAAFKDTCNYFIASMDEMPTLGIGYKDFALAMKKHSGLKPKELSSLLVAIYYNTRYFDYLNYNKKDVEYKMGISLTCIDNSYTIDFLTQFDKLCTSMIAKLVNKDKSMFQSIVKNALGRCNDLTYTSNRNYYAMYNIDIIWFLENLLYYCRDNFADVQKESLRVMAMLNGDVISGFLASNYPKVKAGIGDPDGNPAVGGKGVTITFPVNKEEYKESVIKTNHFYKGGIWIEFLKKYLDI